MTTKVRLTPLQIIEEELARTATGHLDSFRKFYGQAKEEGRDVWARLDSTRSYVCYECDDCSGTGILSEATREDGAEVCWTCDGAGVIRWRVPGIANSRVMVRVEAERKEACRE